MRNFITSTNRVLLLLFVSIGCQQQVILPKIEANMGNAEVKTHRNVLTVKTGKVERTWKWTGSGLVTTGFENMESGKKWANIKPAYKSDWSYYGLINDSTAGKLVSLRVDTSDNEGFTSRHLQVIAQVAYPDVQSMVKYHIWAYPDAPGIYTRVWFKGNGEHYIHSNVSANKNQEAMFDLIKGKNVTPYLARAKAPSWVASFTKADQSIEYHVQNLKPGKRYILALSWWDWNHTGKEATIRVTSIDGKERKILASDQKIPSKPGVLTFRVPASVSTNESFRVFIDKVKNTATVSEIWIYQKDKENKIHIQNGQPDRLEKIREMAPNGFRLIGYLNCGTKFQNKKRNPTGRIDYLPINVDNLARRYIGYYNDTQHRNIASTPLLKEEIRQKPLSKSEINNWANILSLEDGNQGLMIVKESHKTVNQYGVDTGNFNIDSTGISNTGTSLQSKDINPNTYQWAWGSWMIAYQGGNDGRALAIKEFERDRYPIDLSTDMWSLACTWGVGMRNIAGRENAAEKRVLPELVRTHDLGIDMLLIDSGWQLYPHSQSNIPEGNRWHPNSIRYPVGWKNVALKKQQVNMQLGLWGASEKIPLNDMEWNWQQLKMKQFKLDFANLDTHTKMVSLMRKAQKFEKYTNHNCIISWDATEKAPRYGYFWGQQYGDVHFENRKTNFPINVIYTPWLSLRDYWQLAKYNDLHKWQLTIQNPEKTNRKYSNAYRYSSAYCTATALMGVPEFMALPGSFSKKSQQSIKKLMDIYNQVKQQIWNSDVFPIGHVPTDSSFTGFQTYREGVHTGYFMIFRELYEKRNQQAVHIRFLKNQKLKITDLRTKQKYTAYVDNGGFLNFKINHPADFLFLRYQW